MTRKRYLKIEKAVFIWLVNKSNDPVMKSLNKVIYRMDFHGVGHGGSLDWLRTTKLYSYQAAYEFLLEDAYKKMLKEGK